ncbi:hypothetical protein EPK99_23360 [Neorhizobium lilium]|uniref:Uncharacterized protein n=1 Tax=Neorhizobium lilium TaxID=2503024 RepID=A0A444LBJ7_9HYPH|nr:hypothetical protein [Neorhizobium lilium]RWX74836.1 hypothetical protein EPK99_23360 [Neorhizobium lilium]
MQDISPEISGSMFHWISSVKGPRMELPQDCSSIDDLNALREQFDFGYTIMKHAVWRDIGSFTFAGLRVPAVLRDAKTTSDMSQVAYSPLEVVVFQEHLHDRITMLAKNNRMLREIWTFNERSRCFREFELTSTKTASEAIVQTADIVAALRAGSEPMVIDALNSNLASRLNRLDLILSYLVVAQTRP